MELRLIKVSLRVFVRRCKIDDLFKNNANEMFKCLQTEKSQAILKNNINLQASANLFVARMTRFLDADYLSEFDNKPDLHKKYEPPERELGIRDRPRGAGAPALGLPAALPRAARDRVQHRRGARDGPSRVPQCADRERGRGRRCRRAG